MRWGLLKWHDNMMSWILLTWINYDVLEWVGSGSWKALASKVGTSDVYLCVVIIMLVMWMWLICVSA